MEDNTGATKLDEKLIETAKRVLSKSCPHYLVLFGDGNGIGWSGNTDRTWAMGALRRAIIDLEQRCKMDSINDYNKEDA